MTLGTLVWSIVGVIDLVVDGTEVGFTDSADVGLKDITELGLADVVVDGAEVGFIDVAAFGL